MPPKSIVFFSCGTLLLPIFLEAAPAPVDFSRDIRPLLSDRCFKCHGFDDEKREAKLALHNRESAIKVRDGHQAIAPGDPAASELIARITSRDPDEIMPPEKANKPRLSPDEIALVRRWIDQGANYEKHWSFIPPVKSPLPEKSANPIDAFVNQKLRQLGMTANAKADPYTLIRRLSLDLIGLPPSIAEADAFVEKYQASPSTAYSELVDRLLASPRYGERWARDWLDLARYADTNGYEKDRKRSIWPYRDWVIDALNRDLPFDQFTIEQIAGDMLPHATLQQRIATGFHRNTMLNEEGGIDPLEYRFYAMVDRVNTTGTVWLGLTIGCARCHTHKFDPITQTDYYSMMALLGNADEPDLEVPDLQIQHQRNAIRSQIRNIERQAASGIDRKAFTKWRDQQKRKQVIWTPLKPVKLESNLPYLEVVPEDNSIFASGDFTKRDVFTIQFDTSSMSNTAITAIRLEALPDKRLPAHGPGRSYYEGRKGDFFLSEFTAETDQGPVQFRSASVDFGKIQIGSGTAEGKNVFDGDGSTGWSTATGEGKSHELVLNLEKPAINPKTLTIKLLFERHFVAALGRFRISVTTDKKRAVANTSGVKNPATAGDAEWEAAYIRGAPESKKIQKQISNLENSMPQLPTTLVFQERPRENPRATHLHHRGEYLKPEKIVPPAVPSMFQPIPKGQAANRLSFARWLVSDRNPLVARVTVNRAWRAFFGRGIVHTAGDFGYQSELPTHPELLDWLAVDFVEKGWSIKSLHRLIVTSEAYQRSSRATPAQLAKDSQNKFLARGPRHRLSGELIRDAALKAGGLLSEKRGGPSVYPPQPASVTALAYGNEKWVPSTGPDRFRRSLYTFSKRTAPFAAYLVFDGPTGENCLSRRNNSNTPLQALTLLNDSMFGECAEALAKSTLLDQGPDPVDFRSIATEMFRRTLTRPPTEAELDDLLHYFQKQKKRMAAGELSSADLSGQQKSSSDLAAWKMVARAILNLNEAVTKS